MHLYFRITSAIFVIVLIVAKTTAIWPINFTVCQEMIADQEILVYCLRFFKNKIRQNPINRGKCDACPPTMEVLKKVVTTLVMFFLSHMELLVRKW